MVFSLGTSDGYSEVGKVQFKLHPTQEFTKHSKAGECKRLTRSSWLQEIIKHAHALPHTDMYNSQTHTHVACVHRYPFRHILACIHTYRYISQASWFFVMQQSPQQPSQHNIHCPSWPVAVCHFCDSPHSCRVSVKVPWGQAWRNLSVKFCPASPDPEVPLLSCLIWKQMIKGVGERGSGELGQGLRVLGKERKLTREAAPAGTFWTSKSANLIFQEPF